MKFSALKGVHDIIPPESHRWQHVETIARAVFTVYGYQEIRPPIIEATDVFTRSIGETTDIVEKEMYTFTDKAGRSITLRPEGTAPVVRCFVEHHLSHLPAPQKFFYTGPMFRYERPQSGRFRQFYQIGAEAFGVADPSIDAEILSMLTRFFERLGLTHLSIQLNSLGCETCRPDYRKALVDFFSARLEDLCPDCKRRYSQNPLRLLDCKVSGCRTVREGAPHVTAFLCDACREHFSRLRSYLELAAIPHVVNPEMVRGLDYYTRTTFEVICAQLGAQNAVAAGGRYDRLVEDFGGPPTPAIGFAIGMERLTAVLAQSSEQEIPAPDVFVAVIGEAAAGEAFIIAEKMRREGYWVELGYTGQSLKSQLRRADRISARYVLIVGDDELRSGKLKWKRLADGTQGEIGLDQIPTLITSPPAE